MARSSNRPNVGIKSFQVAVTYDDDFTRVRIFTNEPQEPEMPVAEGTAKRTKGDPRDPEVGLALATGRAFEELAKREFAFAEERLNPKPPVPGPMPEWLRDFGLQLRGVLEGGAE